MARASFGRPFFGSVRPALSPAMQTELTTSPIEQAAKVFRPSDTARIGAAKSGLPTVRPARSRTPKNPFSKTANPFYGE